MATTLGQKTVMSTVKIKENGVLVDFYVAKHNYESGLNGAGRTLLVRKDCYDQRQWHSTDVNAYASSAIDSWLNSGYKNLLDADIRAAMGTTKIYYTPGNGNTTKTTLARAVFLLSATELGLTNTNLNAEGTALEGAKTLKIAYLNGSAVAQWTRSPRMGSTSYAWYLYTDGSLNNHSCSVAHGSRPAFTLPSTISVSDDGSVMANTAPSSPGSAPMTLGGMAVGSTVKLKVDGTARDFLVVHQGKPSSLYDDSCDGTWLLMKDIYEERQWHSSNENDYRNSEIHKYLNNAFLTLFEAQIRNKIKSVKIPYRSGSGTIKSVLSGVNGLSAKVFLLSSTEVNLVHGNEPTNEGACLSYFAGTSKDNIDAKRTAKFNDSVSSWRLRSPFCNSEYTTNLTLLVDESGCWYYGYSTRLVGIRPAMILPKTLYVSDDGTVATNTTPTTSSGINVPSPIQGGSTITISWTAATDPDGNLEGYIVERSTDGGSTWTQIYQGSATSATNTVPFGTETVMYRVKAYDSAGAYSGYRTSGQATVINNTAPTAPASITVPPELLGGSTADIAWEPSTDPDGNLAGYRLERQADGGEWTEVYSGSAASFTDTITRGWSTVAYRVRAYDGYGAASAYTTSPARPVNNNAAPVIECETASGTDLGIQNGGFTVDYTASDADGDPVTITEDVDGEPLRSFTAGVGQSYTLDVTGETFMKLLNGSHEATVTAHDGHVSAVHKLTFNKEVTEATVTLKEPVAADDKITICVLSVTGSIPADAEFSVHVTNNAADGAPVWEDCTAEVKNGANHIFENEAAENGFAFNFKVEVRRGESGVGGYINSVQGGFQ